MPTSYFQIVLAAIATYGGWKLLRIFLAPHPFDKIRGPPATSFALGNLMEVFTSIEFNRSASKKYGRITKAYGLFKEPMLYVTDPKALTHIFLKEQQVVYEEDAAFIIGNATTLGKSLLSTTGDEHKKQRKMLNPVFSVAHLKRMVPTFFSVSSDLCDVLLKKTADGPQEIDMVPWLTRTAIEIMARSGFDRSLSPVHEGKEEHRYVVAMKLLIPTGRNLLLLREFVLPFIRTYKIGTPAMHRFIAKLLPWKSLHKLMDITDVMHEVSQDIFHEKKREVEESGLGDEGKKDIFSILMRENAKASISDRLADEEVVSQISTLIFTAMDTTSNSLSRVFWLLSQHRHVYERLREEIREAEQASDGEVDYERLFSLPYLDAVVRETLRLYPPVALVTRTAQKDAILPFSKPIKNADGKEIQEVLVPKGSSIVVSIDGVNTDPELWGPDSFEYKPERWLTPLPKSVTDARVPGVYSHLMTFIGGGRACIGFKFSELEMKVVLFALVSKFEFSPGKREVFWIMDGLTTPSVDRNEPRPQMPVVVSRAA